MGDRKYPTVIVMRFLDEQIVVAVTDAGDDGDDSTVGTGFGIALGESFRLVPVPEGARMDWPVIDGCVAHMRAWMVAIESRCLGYDDEDPCVAGQILLVPMAAGGSE